MTNALTKDTRRSYTPGSPGVAASAGSPARDAYTSYSPKTVCGYVLQGGSYQWKLIDGSYQYLFAPDPGVLVASATYVCTVQQVPTYYPAAPATAPTAGVAPTAEQTLFNYNLGWNAGARSKSFFSGNGYVQFSALAGVSGAVAGLNDVDADAGYSNIEHAFYLTHGVARVLELGVEKAYLGVYISGAVFRIDRKFGVVTYYIDGALAYTSAAPSSGTVFLDASLYAGDDALDNPVVASYNLGTSAVALPPMQTFSRTGTNYAQSSVSFPAMTTAATTLPNGSAAVALLALQTVAADRPYGAGKVSLPALTASSNPGALVPTYAVASSVFVPMTTAGLMLTGGVGSAAVSFPAVLTLSANRVYGASTSSFSPMASSASASEGNLNASMYELMATTSTIRLFGAIEVALFSSMSASTTLATLVLKDAAIAQSMSVGTTIQYSAIMQALMNSVIEAFAGVPVLSQQGDVWVVNDDTGASSNYENYGFTSYAKFQGRHYGVKSDGVYLLEGSTDKGALIRSSIALGRHDFGTTAKKAVPNCYIGLSSSGNVFLKVVADGQTYLYKTVRNNGALTTQRVQLGKGLKASHLVFELYNETGADFEIDSIEFEVAKLDRRI